MSPHVTRLLAVGAVASIVLSWGVAQWDYILPETLTLTEASAPSGTLGALIVATVLGVLLVGPGFIWLYRLDQRGMLPEESIEEAQSDVAAST
jgi:cytochrome d ubiquinol oxidase subunit II